MFFTLARLDPDRRLEPVSLLRRAVPEQLLGGLPRGCVYVAWRSPSVWFHRFPEELGEPSASAAEGALIEEIVGSTALGRAAWRVFWPRPVAAASIRPEDFITETNHK